MLVRNFHFVDKMYGDLLTASLYSSPKEVRKMNIFESLLSNFWHLQFPIVFELPLCAWKWLRS